MAQRPDSDDWRSEFQPAEFAALCEGIPAAIQRSQDRSARAQAAYGDPDGDQDVYGAAMGRGVQKELRAELSDVPSYREVKVPGTRRVLPFIGSALIFALRVGKQMPRDFLRVRMSYLPDSRRELLAETSNVKYVDPGLFGVGDVQGGDQSAWLADALGHLELSVPRPMLFVPYYSSTPHGVGTVYFAPAQLVGRYLEFSDPKRLTHVRGPLLVDGSLTTLKPVTGFNRGERPRTPVKLRQRRSERDGS